MHIWETYSKLLYFMFVSFRSEFIFLAASHPGTQMIKSSKLKAVNCSQASFSHWTILNISLCHREHLSVCDVFLMRSVAYRHLKIQRYFKVFCFQHQLYHRRRLRSSQWCLHSLLSTATGRHRLKLKSIYRNTLRKQP